MCLLVPGKIISIDEDIATVDYGIETREAKLLDDSFTIGDYVLVQGKIAVMKVPEEEAEESLRAYQEVLSQ
ncbi:MAG: HypC/HybG/HupF family hydrogenase formation chaperone [archaeon]